MDKVLLPSKNMDWETPPELIADLAEVFDWNWDVCAQWPNVCENYFTKNDNGLDQEWDGLCWMNPPYGREIQKWMKKARESESATTVCLVPARTDTKWFHDSVEKASLIVFIKGRVHFQRGVVVGPAPFSSCFIVFGNLSHAQRDKLSSYGWRIKL